MPPTPLFRIAHRQDLLKGPIRGPGNIYRSLKSAFPSGETYMHANHDRRLRDFFTYQHSIHTLGRFRSACREVSQLRVFFPEMTWDVLHRNDFTLYSFLVPAQALEHGDLQVYFRTGYESDITMFADLRDSPLTRS